MRSCIETLTTLVNVSIAAPSLAIVIACGFDTSGSGDDGTADDGSGSTASGGAADTSASTPTTDEPTGDPSGQPTGDATTDPDDTGTPTTGPVDYGPFDEPVPLAELNSDGSDDDPTLRADLLEIYFASTRGGTEDLWRATRASVGDPFDAPEPIDALNMMDADETTPELSGDGTILVFASSRPGGPGDLDMYVSTRRDVDGDWSEPELIEALSSEFAEGAAVYTDDRLSAVFCRGQAENGAGLFLATRRDARGDWEVERIESLDTPLSDCSPWISADGAEVWFASNREGSLGANDLWTVTMDGPEAGRPAAIDELNTELDDDDPWLSPDGSTLVFASDRVEAGDVDLYMAVRSAR